MKFKCNFCEKEIPVRMYGDEKIRCSCGAIYTKKKYVEVTLERAPA